MKLNTVNVIEMVWDSIQSLHAFPDDHKGNVDAEKLFVELIKEHESNDVTEKNIAIYLEEGVFDDDCGYQLMLVHSQTE